VEGNLKTLDIKKQCQAFFARAENGVYPWFLKIVKPARKLSSSLSGEERNIGSGIRRLK
jgi:hypothetical protein